MATYQAPTSSTTPYKSNPGAAGAEFRWLNLILGVWLFASAFIWLHTPSSGVNTWVVGVLIVAVSIIAMYVPKARYANTALAVWLFISTLLLPHVTAATPWNNAIVAIAVFFVSLAPGLQRGSRRTGRLASA